MQLRECQLLRSNSNENSSWILHTECSVTHQFAISTLVPPVIPNLYQCCLLLDTGFCPYPCLERLTFHLLSLVHLGSRKEKGLEERVGELFTQVIASTSKFYLGPTTPSVTCSEGFTKHLLERMEGRQKTDFAKSNKQQQFWVALYVSSKLSFSMILFTLW